jgi:hypothetical protein
MPAPAHSTTITICARCTHGAAIAAVNCGLGRPQSHR